MALLRANEVRAMTPEDRQKKLVELRGELMHERGVAAMGGSPPSPGKIRQIRTAIARILTIENQARAGRIEWAKGETPKPSSAYVHTPRGASKDAPAPEPARSARGRIAAKKQAVKSAKNAAAKKTQSKKPKAVKAPAKKPSKPRKEARTGGMDE